MLKKLLKEQSRETLVVLSAFIVSSILIIAGSFHYTKVLTQNKELSGQLDTEKEQLLTTNLEYKDKISELEEELEESGDELNEEKEKIEELREQVYGIADTIGDLEKLSKTDPELLQKYSKVFFLNEHYVPPKLADIDSEYTYSQDRNLQIHGDVWPFLKDLLEEATEDNIDMKIISSYRSFDTQAAIKSSYNITYGADTANQFSADQGFSEHQLGTTVDFTTSTVGSSFSGFSDTEAYRWLQDNAHKFGFILSYPEGNSYYQFEPWHWRFVGEDLADDLNDDKASFYDMDQRTIDEYLISFFD